MVAERKELADWCQRDQHILRCPLSVLLERKDIIHFSYRQA